VNRAATCGALWEWEHDGDPLPQVGDLELPRIGRTPEETMPLVCVRFRVLFKA
jgi:hypothetical protein